MNPGQFIVAYVLFPVASYLLGSVSFGLIAAKIRGMDLRKQGSGNIGATNVVRVLGMCWGAVVFGLDVLKGVIPALVFALIAQAISGAPSWKMLGIVYGACAIFGHVFPVFHHLRGGKAVATSCGVFVCLAPMQLLTAVAIWALALMIWKYVSLASMIAAGTFFIMVLLAYGAIPGSEFLAGIVRTLYPRAEGVPEKSFMTILAFLATAIVFYRHRANIKRLKEGTEPKILTSKEDLRAKEAEEKYGKERLRQAGGRRYIRPRSVEALRRLSRKKQEGEELVESAAGAGEQEEELADSQLLETQAPLEEVEEISADALEPMMGEAEVDTEETRDALPVLKEAPEEPGSERPTSQEEGKPGVEEGRPEEQEEEQPEQREKKPEAARRRPKKKTRKKKKRKKQGKKRKKRKKR